ncbi:hypothetical protein G6F65_019829 [Rhizopus arrhizus]|nr:hypothetical protein G6F65_019829 [Rhizopus arrhizus]
MPPTSPHAGRSDRIAQASSMATTGTPRLDSPAIDAGTRRTTCSHSNQPAAVAISTMHHHQTAEQHLPGGERHHVGSMAIEHPLGQHGADAPAQAAAQPQQHGTDVAQAIPRLHETDQPDCRQADAQAMPDRRADTLPTPPDTSAVCTNPWNPAVCVNPISSVSFHGGIASGRRVAIASANSTMLPVT